MNHILDTISIKGFRSIRDIDNLSLNSINVLVGANGAGKSNFVEAFAFLKAVRNGQLQQYVQKKGGANSILHFGSKVTPQMAIAISFDNDKQYSIALNATEIDTLALDNEDIRLSWELGTRRITMHPRGTEAHVSDPELGLREPMNWVQDQLDGFQIYHFHDTGARSPLKQTANVHDNRFFRPDGANLPAFLLFLREKHPFSYRRICKTVQKVTPFLKDFRLEPLRLNENKIRLEWIHTSSDHYFDVSSLSDGTLRFICLATLLLQPPEERPSIILLDEPELGLHPYAIAMLASMIKSAAVDTQVIISTQSSLLLDHFEPEDILVTELENGTTKIKRLQTSELEVWLEDYSLGQLWEKNQFGGRPQHG